jgi:hypothetical protein
MMHRSFNRELKNLDRAYNSCDLSLRSSALLMPSYECLDVDLLTQNGVFDARTKQVWVERDREVFAHLHVAKEQRKLKSVVIHCGELENYDPIEPLDYVNCDLMGSVTINFARWLSALQEFLLDGATLVINHLVHMRNHPFLLWFRDHYMQNELHEQTMIFRHLSEIEDMQFLAPRILVCCALSKKHFDWYSSHTYHDSGITTFRMSSFRIDNIRPHPRSPWPDIETVIRSYAKTRQPPADTNVRFLLIQERLRENHNIDIVYDLDRGTWPIKVKDHIIREFKNLDDVEKTFEI